MFLEIVAFETFELLEVDVKMAFLNGDHDGDINSKQRE